MGYRAPTRIDFGGSTLDIFPMYHLHSPVITTNLAINRYTSSNIERRDKDWLIESTDQDFSIRCSSLDHNDTAIGLIFRVLKKLGIGPAHVITNSKVPRGSGLGASSSLLCSLIASVNEFLHQEWDPSYIIRMAQHIETQYLEMPTGIQDYYPAVYGGLSKIEFTDGEITYTNDTPSSKFASELESSIILCHTGVSHLSGTDNWNTLKHRIEQSSHYKSYWDEIAILSLSISHALLDEDITYLAEMITNEWNVRKKLHPAIFNEDMKRIVSGVQQYIFGINACGAGNGGVMILFAEKSNHDLVRESVEKNGGQILDWNIDVDGLKPK